MSSTFYYYYIYPCFFLSIISIIQITERIRSQPQEYIISILAQKESCAPRLRILFKGVSAYYTRSDMAYSVPYLVFFLLGLFALASARQGNTLNILSSPCSVELDVPAFLSVLIQMLTNLPIQMLMYISFLGTYLSSDSERVCINMQRSAQGCAEP